MGLALKLATNPPDTPTTQLNLADFDHLKVFFADPTFGTDKVVWDVFPLGASNNILIFAAFGFVVDPTANYTLPLSHSSSCSYFHLKVSNIEC
jgi:hypothetical protein